MCPGNHSLKSMLLGILCKNMNLSQFCARCTEFHMKRKTTKKAWLNLMFIPIIHYIFIGRRQKMNGYDICLLPFNSHSLKYDSRAE